MSKTQECEQCGSCCLQIECLRTIEEEDVRRWVKAHRADILHYCYGWKNNSVEFLVSEEENEVVSYFMEARNRDMWTNQVGYPIKVCPFLRKKRGKNQFECLIQNTKPMMCKKYLCNPKRMMGIVKQPFEVNLKKYKKKKREYRHSVTRSS